MSARLLHVLAQIRHPDRDPGDPPPPPDAARVRRALFGPVDHEENRRFVQRELERGRREASKRWNYDFENDRPLEGRHMWEPVAPEGRRNSYPGGGEKTPAVDAGAPRSADDTKVSRDSFSDAFRPFEKDDISASGSAVSSGECDTRKKSPLSVRTETSAAAATGTTTTTSLGSSTSASSRTSQRQTSITGKYKILTLEKSVRNYPLS